MKKYILDYTVSGCGQFPIDMLRYDRSFPADESQSGKIVGTLHNPEPWTVGLCMHTNTKREVPCEGRWKSFGCTVQIQQRQPI